MTAPDQSSPDGSLGPGLFAQRQAMTEADAKTQMKAPLGAWDAAQNNMKGHFVSAALVNGEVVRLDNRIDEIIIGTERAFLYTFSESGVWEKHPAAYKVIVDVLSGASNGRNGVNSTTGGAGGFSGGWERYQFTGSALEDLPNSLSVTIGAGLPGGSNATAGASSFGSFSSSGASQVNYGTGSRTYKIRGGNGGNDTFNGSDGGAGPFHPGGSGGLRTGGTGGNGGHGFSLDVGQIGIGSAGGGGAGGTSIIGAGGNGGHGGWPSAPGGGGGGGYGGVGAGGNGAGGAVFVTVYVADEFGIPPSTPSNLAASGVSATSATVTWDASIDDVLVRNYVLFLNGNRYGVVDTTSHQFVGLTPSTDYTVRVQAVDVGDNASELSAPLTFTTLAS